MYSRLILAIVCIIQLFHLSVHSIDENTIDEDTWVESKWNQMTESERIAQLLMIPAYSCKYKETIDEVVALVRDYRVGGVIFFQGDPARQALFTNQLQKSSKIPLMIAMDAEWGLGMRLQGTISYPKAMTLGAIQDTGYITQMGQEVARQMKALGVHINFAPVLDVNNNPNNPVIGQRAFGDTVERVTESGLAMALGLKMGGCMAVGKHFPGHGDTSEDSHKTLPVLQHTKERFQTLELCPFKEAIKQDIGGIMVAHLHVPAYDSAPNQATTTSKVVVQDLLRDTLKFSGLIFTDALNMKAVSEHLSPGEIARKALEAGNDILVFPENIPEAIVQIQKAIKENTLTWRTIEEKVKRILRFKAGLGIQKTIDPIEVQQQLNTPQARMLKQTLFEKSVTLISNLDGLLPINDVRCIASVSIISGKPGPETSGCTQTYFSTILDRYANVTHYTIPRCEAKLLDQLPETLKSYKIVVVDIHGIGYKQSDRFGLSDAEIKFVKKLNERDQLILVPFGSVYSLAEFKDIKNLLVPYEDDPVAEHVAAQVVMGALPAIGKLPVNVSEKWPAGHGIDLSPCQRLGYAEPESVGIDSAVLAQIDEIVQETLISGAAPGCQILIAKDGKIIFEKAYGYQTYLAQKPVTTETLYDLASITKVAGGAQAMMYLVGNRRLNVNKRLSYYLPVLRRTNKGGLRIRKVLAHQAGLKSYINIAQQSFYNPNTKQLCTGLVSTLQSDSYPHPIGLKCFGATDVRERIWDACVKSSLTPCSWFFRHQREYSCIGLVLMNRIVEKQLGQPVNIFMKNEFYEPLGLKTLGYLPLERHNLESIAPTLKKKDILGRCGVHGFVNDPMAALQGGVSGNAGLFSNARDLATLLQMNLQDGAYGGKRYIAPGIIGKFTKKQVSMSRCGLVWDKPTGDLYGLTSIHSSSNTYGHCGYTGTGAWVDPVHNLIYVFLSNRTYPDDKRKKLLQNNIRIRIHDVIYHAMDHEAFPKNRCLPDPEKPVPGADQPETYLPKLTGKRVAMIVNPTSCVGDRHILDVLLEHKIQVKKIFAPEHGLRGEHEAEKAIQDGVDKVTGIPVISLYGKVKQPTSDMLKDVDLVLFDIQDVGVRCYTYTSTLHNIMDACAAHKIPLIVLDRPNPNGHYVDGPVLDNKFRSFVGKHPIPLVHGLTLGELARMINGEGWLVGRARCNLTVIPVRGYRHDTFYALPVPPSPNLSNTMAISWYPSLVFFEGTTMNAGRGTIHPFQCLGHTKIMNLGKFSYVPVGIPEKAPDPKHKDQMCYGIDLRSILPGARIHIEYLCNAYKAAKKAGAEFFGPTFDLHAGSDKLRKQLEAGLSAEEIRASWHDGLLKYHDMRKPYLLYK